MSEFRSGLLRFPVVEFAEVRKQNSYAAMLAPEKLPARCFVFGTPFSQQRNFFTVFIIGASR